MKKFKLALLIVSLFFTLPASGLMFAFNPYLGTLIYLSQAGTSIILLKEWYKNTP